MAVTGTTRPLNPWTGSQSGLSLADAQVPLNRQLDHRIEARFQPVDFIYFETDATVETVGEVQTNLRRVHTGILIELSTDYVYGATVLPKSTDPSIASLTGLVASKKYLLAVYGEK